MLDNQQKCKICGKDIVYDIGGFNSYHRRGICTHCHSDVKTKVCKGYCGQEKPIAEFRRLRDSLRIDSWCKVCYDERTKVYRKNQPKKEKRRKVEKTDADLFNQLNKRW